MDNVIQARMLQTIVTNSEEWIQAMENGRADGNVQSSLTRSHLVVSQRV